MSPPPDSTLDDPQQIIAELQRQLAESNAERDEALGREAASAEVLQVINSSPGDLAPVFDAMVERAKRLCGAANAALFTFDGELFHLVAAAGEPQLLEQAQSFGPIPSTNAMHGRLAKGEDLVHIADVRETDLYRESPILRERVGLWGLRTWLAVALRKEDVLLGTIAVSRKEVRPFSEREIALLQNFAAQAVIAMENARLITETREALEQQTATAEVLGVINSSPGDLGPVFDSILEKAHSLCGATFGSLQIYDGEFFRSVAARGLPAAFVEMVRQPFRPDPNSFEERVVRGEDFVHVPDVTALGPLPDNAISRAAVEMVGLRTVLLLPLRRETTLVGYIAAARSVVQPFADREIALLQNFAAQAVIAMENARLITETREALEQQTATAEVLGVINSSPGDLAPVFAAMLEKALRLCGAAFGALFTYDGKRFPLVSSRGFPTTLLEYYREPIGPPPPGSAMERLVRGESTSQATDIRADAFGSPIRRALADLGGARTMIWVALRKEEALLGCIAIYRQEMRPFSEKEIALLENFAAQAVIAMENARLITETREALEQQTATAEVLGVINSSPGDLAPVFDAMVGKALRLCEAAYGHLNIYDGERFCPVAAFGEPKMVEWLKQRGPVRPASGTTMERIARGEDIVHIADVRDEEAYRQGEPSRRALVEIGGCRTLLSVALRKDNAVLGAFVIYRQEVRPFTERQIALLQNFAAQAVIAMENARLITETREALEQQTATAEVLGVINSSPGDLAPVFDAMLEKATRLCDGSQGVLWTLENDSMRCAAMFAATPEYAAFLLRGASPGPATPMGRILQGERVIEILDLAEDEGYRAGDPVPRAAVEMGGLRSMIFVALVREETLLGGFAIARPEVRPFTEKQIALLQNFAAQAVIAMENARLIAETREALEQQTATAEVLQVINSSPGDLVPVFDAMLEKAMRLCGAVYGNLLRYEGELLSIVAAVHADAKVAEWSRRIQPFRPTPGGPLDRMLHGEAVTAAENMTETDSYRARAEFREMVDRLGYRSVLNVALRKNDALFGVISIFREEAGSFSDKQIALLQNFAAQAVIAMENARLITETREALEQQTATAEVLGVINSSPGDLAPVFDAILEKAHTLCGADHGTLTVFDGESCRAIAMRGIPEGFAEVLRQPFQPGGLTEKLSSGAAFVHIADLTEAQYSSDNPLHRAAIGAGGVRTLLAVPLRRENDVLLGYVTANRREVRPFTDKQIALLRNFAAQAVIATENARLLSELRQRTEEVGELNRDLEARVAAQVDELGRVGRLKRFLAPQLAELIVSHGDEKILESHRREIVVVFCDLRGYTAFTETAEPEEVLDFLRQYHGALGPLVSQFEGTLDQFSGDGIMVFFNDPVPCLDPAERAVKMAVAMRSAASTLIAEWRERGRDLGFGAGIAQGYATLGQIGFSERSGYTAIGTVCNVAARLCAEAKDGQILLGQLVNVALKGSVATEQLGPLTLKGLSQPVVAYNVPLAAIQPALRVIEGGSPQTV